jgi:hypothetical protein
MVVELSRVEKVVLSLLWWGGPSAEVVQRLRADTVVASAAETFDM